MPVSSGEREREGERERDRERERERERSDGRTDGENCMIVACIYPMCDSSSFLHVYLFDMYSNYSVHLI